MLSRNIGLAFFLLFVLLLTGSAQTDLTAANRLFEEAETLRRANSAESKRAAIAKFEAAIPLFAAAGAKERLASCYKNIGTTRV
ncbi:MAG TPA: hypothetical protein PKD26_03740 [Pyrinomonadaceae bacterium]|nr:hypothetical protein [Pyrinomonadaceae bacterium]